MIKLNPKNSPNKSHEKGTNELNTSQKVENPLLNFITILKNQRISTQEFDALSNTIENLKFNSTDDFNNLKEITLLLTNLLKVQTFNAHDKKQATNLKDNEIRFKLPNVFKPLEPLLEEIIDDNPEIAKVVLQLIQAYLGSIENVLIDVKINEVYTTSSTFMNQLSEFDFSQRKYVYKAIVEIFNDSFTKYKFISPEDSNHIDTEIHKIVQGDSLRIKCGLSFVLLDKNSNSVIEYGKVKTY